MSIKINRYPATEGGNWTKGGRNIMTIPVPDVGFTDLENSYAVFRVQPEVIGTDGEKFRYPMVFADHCADPADDPPGLSRNYAASTGMSLIRNTKVTYEKVQLQNERIEQNVYFQNMDWYLNSRGNQNCAAMINGSANYNYGQIGGSGLPNTPFFQYSRPSVIPAAGGDLDYLTVYSQMRNPDIFIPMKHLDQLAEGMNQFPMTVFGKTIYNIVLENVMDVVAPAQMPQFITCDDLTFAVNGDIGSSDNPLILTELYTSNRRLNDVPIYVGAPMNFKYTTADEEVHIAAVIISAMAVNSDGEIYLQFETPIATGLEADIVITNLVLVYKGYKIMDGHDTPTYQYPDTQGEIVTEEVTLAGISANWQITNAWIELHELKLLPDQQKAAIEALRSMEIPYYECFTDRRNMIATSTQYCETVPYQQNCIGLAIMTPQPNTMTSGFNNALQYRHKLKNKDVQGRWVIVGPEQETNVDLPVGRQYHNYLLQAFFMNMGKALRKFDAPWSNYIDYKDSNTHAFFPLIVDGAGAGGTVSVNIQAIGGEQQMSQKTVYWQFIYERLLVIKAGRLVSVM